MPIAVTCQKCPYKGTVPDGYAGKNVRCPKCKAMIAVPAAAPQSSSPRAGVLPPAPAGTPNFGFDDEDDQGDESESDISVIRVDQGFSAPWYYKVCQVATLTFGAYAFIVLGLLTLSALWTLIEAMTWAGAGGPEFRGMTVGIALFQLGMYFGSMLLTVVFTTVVLVILDAGRRLREVRAALQPR